MDGKESISLPAAEGLQVEFKQKWTDAAKETFCSFLNTAGGRIFFGVNDEGAVVGDADPDETERRINSIFRFAMHPEAGALCRTRTCEANGKNVVVAEILEGRNPPYFVTINKIRKCYLRHGSSNFEANEDELRMLYRKGDPTPFELRPSSEQSLTFNTLTEYFKAADIEFSPQKYQTLGLKTKIGFYSNLAYWLSDQSTVKTRVGFFSGTERTSPCDGIFSFTGCIIDQYQKIRSLLNNRFGFSYQIGAFDVSREGARNEVKEYPEAAIREALVNMFAHRDYSIPGDSFVTCFADRMEMMSFGGLLPNTDLDLIKAGASIPRNPMLAELLLRLSAMEKYGIGIPLVIASYKPYGLEPDFQIHPRAFTIVLPKIRLHYGNLNEREQKVVEFLRRNGVSKRADIQEMLGKSFATTMNVLNGLMASQTVERTGKGRDTRYRLR